MYLRVSLHPGIVPCMPLGPGKMLARVAGLKPEPPTHLLRTLTVAEKVTLFKFYLGHKNSCCVPPLSESVPLNVARSRVHSGGSQKGH